LESITASRPHRQIAQSVDRGASAWFSLGHEGHVAIAR
jgi:hypothetical protein